MVKFYAQTSPDTDEFVSVRLFSEKLKTTRIREDLLASSETHGGSSMKRPFKFLSVLFSALKSVLCMGIFASIAFNFPHFALHGTVYFLNETQVCKCSVSFSHLQKEATIHFPWLLINLNKMIFFHSAAHQQARTNIKNSKQLFPQG